MPDSKHYMDMCEGPLLGKMIRFAVPYFCSNVLQLLFHAADLIVVGRYASHQAMAAIGSTSSLTILCINILLGLSVGGSVLASQFYGAKRSNLWRRPSTPRCWSPSSVASSWLSLGYSSHTPCSS